MARKITTATYEVSPTETLTFTISGPLPVTAALDGRALNFVLGQPLGITPAMLNGAASHHFLLAILLFPPEDKFAHYDIAVESGGNQLDTLAVEPPAAGNSIKAQFDIFVRL
jgi:hypothetical protein